MSEDFEDNNEVPEDEIPEKEPMPEMDEPESLKADMGGGDMDVTADDKLWALLAYVLTPLIPIIIMLMADK
ncbi:MAG: hypothetical protein IAF02_22525, partial [Anaerolineae bacterium]|nr:hypothetical protein [Anaerolineae bacterium]